jgi:hypothetical protein
MDAALQRRDASEILKLCREAESVGVAQEELDVAFAVATQICAKSGDQICWCDTHPDGWVILRTEEKRGPAPLRLSLSLEQKEEDAAEGRLLSNASTVASSNDLLFDEDIAAAC